MDSAVRRFGALTPDQVTALDLAAGEVGVDVVRLMEVAGFQVARLAWRMLGRRRGQVHVVAGHGNNGGDGLVAARHLSGWGCAASCAVLGEPERLGQLLVDQVTAARGAGVAVTVSPVPVPPRRTDAPDLVIDALLGVGMRSAPRAAFAEAITAIDGRVLSVDVPSGVDAADGTAPGAVVVATATCTFCAVKSGLWTPAAAAFVGELYVADIGMPRQAFARSGVDPPGGVRGGAIRRVPRE